MASISWTVLSGLSRPSSWGPGPAAAHVDRGHCRGIENDRGHAGGERCVVGVADANAGYVGDEIFQRAGSVRPHLAGPVHGYISRAECSTGKRKADHPGEFGFAVGFRQQQHPESTQA
jgi:hypothetical protein